jgi:hypothetical protein
MSESDISEKKYAWFWEKEYKTRGKKMEPIVKGQPKGQKKIEGLYFAGAFIATSAFLGEIKYLYREGALLNPMKALRLYGQRGKAGYQSIKAKGRSVYQTTKRGAIKTRDAAVRLGDLADEKFETMLDADYPALEAIPRKFNEIKDISNQRIIEPLIRKWVAVKDSSKRIKITIRSNNKNEISVFANQMRMYSGDKNLTRYFTNSVVPQIPRQDYHSFPVDDQKIGAMFLDKKIYLQNYLRPQQGPFYQVEAEFDAKYFDTLEWINFLRHIFNIADQFNQSSESKYQPTYGNFGVQVIIESIPNDQE